MRSKSFTLIEVVIFIGIISVFLVTMIGSSASYIRFTKYNENKLLATRYGEELMEWVKGDKEDDWLDFVTTRSSVSPGTTWCFNSNPAWQEPAGACSGYGLASKFKREVVLVNQDLSTNTQVNVTVTVYWLEGDQPKQVQFNSIFTVPE